MTEDTAARKRGRPRTGWTQVGLKLLPDQLARLDAWRDDNGQPTRAEAIRRLMDVALATTQQPPVEVDDTEFKIGDRVRSDVYGLGKVAALEPARPDRGMTRGTVAVAWDRREWGITNVLPGSLEFVSRPRPL